MRRAGYVLGPVLALAMLVGALAVIPTRTNEPTVSGFTSVRDDALAARHAPVLFVGAFEQPIRLLYRMARDSAGRTHIAYHFVWEYERNNAPGWGPFLSRWVYTGGLGLQRIMFGRGDVETLALVIGPSDRVLEFAYETAEQYNPREFGVRHRTVRIRAPQPTPAALRVMSWNHLFEEAGSGSGNGARVALHPEYFTAALWEEYSMFKATETFFSRSRAHEPFERASAP